MKWDKIILKNVRMFQCFVLTWNHGFSRLTDGKTFWWCCVNYALRHEPYFTTGVRLRYRYLAGFVGSHRQLWWIMRLHRCSSPFRSSVGRYRGITAAPRYSFSRYQTVEVTAYSTVLPPNHKNFLILMFMHVHCDYPLPANLHVSRFPLTADRRRMIFLTKTVPLSA